MGRVVLVGAGPGAADLITVRGLRLLQSADCVFYDALVCPELLAHIAPSARQVAVGKRCGQRSTAQHFINKQLVQAAQKHTLVVRLKGGDPMVFGRADEELQALKQAGVDVEVVPGVTAAVAAAASLQTSLTLRGVARSLVITTPAVGQHEAPNSQPCMGQEADTVAIYMGLRQAQGWAAQLLAQGRAASTPVVVCVSVSRADEQFLPTTLGALPHLHVEQFGEGPCLILMGRALAGVGQQQLPQTHPTVGSIKKA